MSVEVFLLELWKTLWKSTPPLNHGFTQNGSTLHHLWAGSQKELGRKMLKRKISFPEIICPKITINLFAVPLKYN